MEIEGLKVRISDMENKLVRIESLTGSINWIITFNEFETMVKNLYMDYRKVKYILEVNKK